MMDYYNSYKNLLGLNKDNSFQDNVIANNKRIVLDSFNNSFMTEKVLIDNVEYDVLFKQEKKSENKKIIFRPDTKIDIGSVAQINNLNYLIMDFFGEGINEIYPTALLKLCNSTFPIQSDKTSVLLTDENGNPILDDDGRPIDVETGGSITNEPCIVETKVSNGSDNTQLPLPEGRINITMKYQVGDNLTVNSQFQMYGNTYKILDIDYTKVINSKGIMKISAERVVSE